MMSLPRLLPFLVLAGSLMAGTRIGQYRITLTAQPDGSGLASASVDLDGCVPGPILVPVGFSSLDQVRLEAGPAGARLEPGPRGLRLQLPEGVASTCQVAFSFPVAQVFLPPVKGNTGEKPLPAGNRLFRHSLVNTQEAAIADYRFQLRLADGIMVQAIREQGPKLGKTEAGPRVRLDRVGTRQGALLQAPVLAQGDATSVTLELTPTRKSPMWLLVGACLAGLYLFYFRDLVAAKPA